MMDTAGISEYTMGSSVTPVESPIVVTKTTKKRKITQEKTSSDELKQKARMLCTSAEQWRSVSRYSVLRLDQWVQDKEFEQTTAFHENVFDFVHKSYAVILDKLSGGAGYVEDQLLCDLSLKAALVEECYKMVGFITNKYRILALTTADCTHAKRLQWKENPPVETHVVEEINGDNDYENTNDSSNEAVNNELDGHVCDTTEAAQTDAVV
jgi:hypothetical protein